MTVQKNTFEHFARVALDEENLTDETGQVEEALVTAYEEASGPMPEDVREEVAAIFEDGVVEAAEYPATEGAQRNSELFRLWQVIDRDDRNGTWNSFAVGAPTPTAMLNAISPLVAGGIDGENVDLTDAEFAAAIAGRPIDIGGLIVPDGASPKLRRIYSDMTSRLRQLAGGADAVTLSEEQAREFFRAVERRPDLNGDDRSATIMRRASAGSAAGDRVTALGAALTHLATHAGAELPPVLAETAAALAARGGAAPPRQPVQEPVLDPGSPPPFPSEPLPGPFAPPSPSDPVASPSDPNPEPAELSEVQTRVAALNGVLAESAVTERLGLENLGVDLGSIAPNDPFWQELRAIDNLYREHEASRQPITREEIIALANEDGVLIGDGWDRLLGFIETQVDRSGPVVAGGAGLFLADDEGLTPSGEVLAQVLGRAEATRSTAGADGSFFRVDEFDGAGLELAPGVEEEIRAAVLVDGDRAFELATRAIYGEARASVLASDAQVNAVLERFSAVSPDDLEALRAELPWAQRLAGPEFSGDISLEDLRARIPELRTHSVDVATLPADLAARLEALSALEPGLARKRNGRAITADEVLGLAEGGFINGDGWVGTQENPGVLWFAENELDRNGEEALVQLQRADGSLTPTGAFLGLLLDRAEPLEFYDGDDFATDSGGLFFNMTQFDAAAFTAANGIDLNGSAVSRLRFRGVVDGAGAFATATELVYGEPRERVRADDNRVQQVLSTLMAQDQVRVRPEDVDALREALRGDWDLRFTSPEFAGNVTALHTRLPELAEMGIDLGSIPEDDPFWRELEEMESSFFSRPPRGVRTALLALAGNDGVLTGDDWGRHEVVGDEIIRTGLIGFAERVVDANGSDRSLELQTEQGALSTAGAFLSHLLDRAGPVVDAGAFTERVGDSVFLVNELSIPGVPEERMQAIRDQVIVDGGTAFQLITELALGEAREYVLNPNDNPDFVRVRDAFMAARLSPAEAREARRELFGAEYGQFPEWFVNANQEVFAGSAPVTLTVDDVFGMLTAPDADGNSVIFHTQIADGEEPGVLPRDAAYINTVIPGLGMDALREIAEGSDTPDAVLTGADWRPVLQRLATDGQIALRDENGITPAGELLSLFTRYRGQVMSRDDYAESRRTQWYNLEALENPDIRARLATLTGVEDATLRQWSDWGFRLGFEDEGLVTSNVFNAIDMRDNSGSSGTMITDFGRDVVSRTATGVRLDALHAAIAMSPQDFHRMVFASLPPSIQAAIPQAIRDGGIPDGSLYAHYDTDNGIRSEMTWADVSVATTKSDSNRVPRGSRQERNVIALQPLSYALMAYVTENFNGGEARLTSVYRNLDVARAVGSGPGSYHTLHGTAIDIQTDRFGGDTSRYRRMERSIAGQTRGLLELTGLFENEELAAIRREFAPFRNNWLGAGQNGLWGHDGHLHVGFRDFRDLPIGLPTQMEQDILTALNAFELDSLRPRLRPFDTGGSITVTPLMPAPQPAS